MQNKTAMQLLVTYRKKVIPHPSKIFVSSNKEGE